MLCPRILKHEKEKQNQGEFESKLYYWESSGEKIHGQLREELEVHRAST